MKVTMIMGGINMASFIQWYEISVTYKPPYLEIFFSGCVISLKEPSFPLQK